MPRRRRFTSFRRTGATKRKWEWIYVEYDSSTAVASDHKDLLVDWKTKLGITANLPDMTVARVRGTLHIECAAQTLHASSTGIQVGMLVWPATQLANVPLPLTDPWNDWNYWAQHYIDVDGAVPANASESLVAGMPVDVKAMRKLRNIDDTLVLVWEAIGNVWRVHGTLAIGVKLP